MSEIQPLVRRMRMNQFQYTHRGGNVPKLLGLRDQLEFLRLTTMV
jgi:hypothetical protein